MPTTTLYKPSDAEMKQIGYVEERMEKMKKTRSAWEDKWNQADKQYQMHRKSRPKDEWRADLHLPMTFSVVETALSEMVDQSPGVTLLPRESGDTENAQKLEKIWEYTWEKGNGDVELMRFMKNALLYGTAIGEEYYRQDVVVRKEMNDFDLDSFKPTDWKKRESLGYDDCYFENIPLWDFYIDPRATSLDNAMDCVKRVVMNKDTFQFRYKKYANAKKVTGGGNVFKPQWFNPTDVWADDEIEVWHYYNRQKDLYLVIANGVMLTPYNNPNPYKHKDFPFVHGVDVFLPHCFYGLGEAAVVESLEDELNTMRNMRLDTTHLNIQTQFLVDDRLEMDDTDLISRPHGIIRGAPGSIEPVPFRPINSEAYREEELLKDDIIRATGIDPRLQSLGGKGDTATEVAILKESSLKRIRLKLRVLEKVSLRRIARLRIANIQQFYAIPRITMVVGESGQPEPIEQYKGYGMRERDGQYRTRLVKPGDLTGDYDFVVVPGSTLPISESLEAQKSVNLFDRLKGHPDVNQRKLAEDLIRVHKKNPAEIMTQPGEPIMGQAPGSEAAIPNNATQRPGFNQNKLKMENVMPQKITGNTPNLNQ